MTQLNLNTASKSALIAHAESLAAENTQLRTTAQNAVNLANYFAFNLETIEKFILNSPIGKGKFFKTFFFIVGNWKSIVQLLEDIVNQIKEWRDKVEELREASKNQPAEPGLEVTE